jgi:hypothetical protein
MLVRWILALCVGAALLLPPSTAWAAGPDYEQAVVDQVNQIRVTAGLSRLTVSSELTTSARRYSSYMASAGFFGHVAPDGSTLVNRDQAAGYTGWTWLGENLAAGQTDPKTVVQAWMNSPTHRANILAPQPREIGVGFVYVPGTQYGYYWTQEFGTRPGVPGSASAQAPNPPTSAPAPPKPTPVVPAPQKTTAPAPLPSPTPLATPARSVPSTRGDRPTAAPSQVSQQLAPAGEPRAEPRPLPVFRRPV